VVALARKLLVALWRYVETGEVPAGMGHKPGITRQRRDIERVRRVAFPALGTADA
jgi:hypothetical protein